MYVFEQVKNFLPQYIKNQNYTASLYYTFGFYISKISPKRVLIKNLQLFNVFKENKKRIL